MMYNSIVAAILIAWILVAISYGIVSIVKLILFFARKYRIARELRKLGPDGYFKVIWIDVTSIGLALGSEDDKDYFKIIFQHNSSHCLLYANGKFYGTVTAKTVIERIKKIKDVISTARRNQIEESHDN